MTSKRVQFVKNCLLQLACAVMSIMFIQPMYAAALHDVAVELIPLHAQEERATLRATLVKHHEHHQEAVTNHDAMGNGDTERYGENTPSVDDIMQLLEERVDSLQDIQAVITLQQLDDAGRSVVNEAKMEVEMALPGMLRLTFLRPDLLQGNVFVLDYEADNIYEYYPVYDLVQCLPLETYLETSPLEPMINTLNGLIVGVPNGDVVTDLQVVETTTLHGREHVLLRGEARTQVVDSGLEDMIEDTAESTIGVPITVRADDVMYMWVDMENHMVSQIHVVTAEGNLAVAVEIEDVQVNSKLTVDDMKRFPRGAEIRRCS